MKTIWMLQALHSRHAKLHATRDPMVTRGAKDGGSALGLQFCKNRGTTLPTLVCVTRKIARRSFQLRLQQSVETQRAQKGSKPTSRVERRQGEECQMEEGAWTEVWHTE